MLQDNNFNVDDYDSSDGIDGSDSYIPIMTLNYQGSWNASTSNTNNQVYIEPSPWTYRIAIRFFQ